MASLSYSLLKNCPPYGNEEYWKVRYEVSDPNQLFDFYGDFTDFTSVFDPLLASAHSALIVGCGNSGSCVSVSCFLLDFFVSRFLSFIVPSLFTAVFRLFLLCFPDSSWVTIRTSWRCVCDVC